MIKDLLGQGTQETRADVLVIGAGTAGLVVATKLARQGLRVVVLECGGRHQVDDTHPYNEVIHARAEFAGAAHGRFRCLGGTSTRWGGAMLPFLAADLDPELWPLGIADLTPYLSELESLFGLPHGSYEMPGLIERLDRQDQDYIARLAKWPRFGNRNVANLVLGDLESTNGPDVWLNATATEFKVDAPNYLRTVTALAPDKSSITVEAKEIVFAAGAIETTRMLLILDQQNGNRICAEDDQLGRHFHDHLSVAVGTLKVRDRQALNRLLGFRFDSGGTMRNLRFELADHSGLRDELPPHFVHFAFREDGDSGFNALRDLFRALQRRQLPAPAILFRLIRGLPWLMRAGWWRFAENRLLYPSDAEIEVHMVIEQTPRADDRVTLSSTRRDGFGLPLAVIDWSVATEDLNHLDACTDAFVDAWAHSPLSKLAEIVPRPKPAVRAELATGGGIYHPCGSIRMARSPSVGVVDSELRLFRLQNATVLSTAVFPTVGGANPTMMLLLCALYGAERIARRLALGLSAS